MKNVFLSKNWHKGNIVFRNEIPETLGFKYKM